MTDDPGRPSGSSPPPKPGSAFDSGQVEAWSVAWNMAGGVIGGVILGALIDWLAGTRPWFTLSFALVGLAGGMIRFIKEGVALNRSWAGREQRTESSAETGGPPAARDASVATDAAVRQPEDVPEDDSPPR